MSKNVRNWKSPVYDKVDAETLNPAGNSLQELKETELENYAGAGTANTVCNCYSGEHSCGRLCTLTSECPVMTVVCC